MIINDTMLQDSLEISKNVLSKGAEIVNANKVWMWLAIFELIIIFYLLFITKKKFHKQNTKMKFKKDSMKESIDFGNIINSSFNSNQLYNELKVKCHPDRFSTDENKNKIADALFQEITKNKTNCKRLIELKEEAKLKLNVNF